ncbi:MAG: hypothetical protein MR691_02810 [Clostridium sp.]|nr:hypothetical protein [Clostridium sp.]
MKERDNINNKAQNNSETIDELYEQLGIINLSIDTIFVIVAAISLNIKFLIWSKVGVLDKINNTKNAEEIGDLSELPKVANLMYIYATGIFLLINYSQFKNVSSLKETTKRQKCKAWKAFLSSLFIFIATGLTKDNLEI